MDLSQDLVNDLVMFTFGGLGAWLAYLHNTISGLREKVHTVEIALVEQYAKKDELHIVKEELRQVVSDALSPLREAFNEFRSEIREDLRSLRGPVR